MSALAVLQDARAAGITIRVVGDGLGLEAQVPPPNEILHRLVRYKPEIVNLLRRSWSAEAWQAFFDERAGILEHECGLSPPEAEARAFKCCVAEYINQTHTASYSDVCAQCGTREAATRPLIPVGTEKVGHVWVLCNCLTHWQMVREHRAALALRDMGITPLPYAVKDHPSSA